MPDSSSSSDDPFADLFAKLPDPRRRDAPSVAPSTAPSVAPSTAPSDEARGDRPVEPARDGAGEAGAAPVSRRAAREAAARTGSVPTASDAPPAPPVPPRPAADAARSLPPTQAMPVPVTAAAPMPDIVPADAPDATASAAGPLRGSAPGPAKPVSTPPTLDDLFTEAGSGGGSHEPPKKKRHIGGWIALGIVLVLIGGVVGGGVWVWNTYESKIREVMGWEEPKDFEPGLAHGEVMVTIAEGDVPTTISRTLFEAGVTKTSSAFYDMLIKTKQNPTFYPGVYKLQLQMTAADALEALKNDDNKLENSALLREGLTVDQMLPILADSLSIPIEDFQAAVAKPSDYGVAANSLEGWLFPAMYTFDPGVTATQVIQKMVDQTIKALDDAGVPVADRQRVLTIASIIQREARFEDDFYKVSTVIENRMNPNNQETFGLLQMDSTAQYGYREMHDGTVSSSAEALADDNLWNTYKHPGLPVGPISNPGAVAIDAAMHPADGPWLYFVTVNLDTGETVFTKTLSEHNKAVRQWQNWCKANPDSGC